MTETTEQHTGADKSRRVVRGAVLTKAKLSLTLGMSQDKIDTMIARGAPVVQRGSKVENREWQISVKEFVEFMIEEACAKLKDKSAPEVGGMSYDAARRKDKEVQATIREIELLKLRDQLVDAEDVRPVLREVFATVRLRMLSIATQVTGLNGDQHHQLQDAVNDALAELSEGRIGEWNAEASAKLAKH